MLLCFHSVVSHQDGAIDSAIDRAALAEVCTLWVLFSCFFDVLTDIWDSAINYGVADIELLIRLTEVPSASVPI